MTNCEVPECQSQSKHTDTPYLYIYVCPTSVHQGFQYGYKHKKKYFYNTLFSISFGSIHII